MYLKKQKRNKHIVNKQKQTYTHIKIISTNKYFLFRLYVYFPLYYITVNHQQNKNPKTQHNKKTYNQIPPFI